jgi:hypothetical protein
LGSALRLEQYPDCVTDAHALAETFATLTGFYKVPVDAATELTLGLKVSLRVETLPLAIYETAIREARSRGVMGGGIYDSLHSTFARSKRATRIITRNPSHFAHNAPDLGDSHALEWGCSMLLGMRTAMTSPRAVTVPAAATVTVTIAFFSLRSVT